MQLRPSEETLHESLSEEQDDEDASLEDTMPLASLEEEEMQSALPPSTTTASKGQSIREIQDGSVPENEVGPLQEEVERASASELSQESQTHSADPETPPPSDHKTEASAEEELSTVHQTLAAPSDSPLVNTELPALGDSDVPSPRASFKTKCAMRSGFTAQEAILTAGRITSPPRHPLVSRTLTQARVSELKKRFEA